MPAGFKRIEERLYPRDALLLDAAGDPVSGVGERGEIVTTRREDIAPGARPLTYEEWQGAQELHGELHWVFHRLAGDGRGKLVPLQRIEQARRAYQAVFGYPLDDAQWWRDHAVLVREATECHLEEGTPEEALDLLKTPRKIGRLVFVPRSVLPKWVTDKTLLEIFRSSQLGRGGGRGKRSKTIEQAALDAVNQERSRQNDSAKPLKLLRLN